MISGVRDIAPRIWCKVYLAIDKLIRAARFVPSTKLSFEQIHNSNNPVWHFITQKETDRSQIASHEEMKVSGSADKPL